MKTFRGIIDDKSSGHREMAVAVRGYGYFAAVSWSKFTVDGSWAGAQ